MTPVPLLFLGDSPNLRTGLGRITRDLSCLVAAKIPEYRVGVLGREGIASSQIPYPQYTFTYGWGETTLPHVWADFARGQRGVLMSIWDPYRVHWIGYPTEVLGETHKLLRSGKISKWGYFAIDAEGPFQRLSAISKSAVAGYDRVLAYGAFGANVIQNTFGLDEVEWIPHGLNADVFQPRDKTAGKLALGVSKAYPLIGCNMTNQPRKDWGMAIGIIAALKTIYPDLKMWAHVDDLTRHWDLRALPHDFGVQDRVVFTESGGYDDKELSYMYSACDLTILPSLGEGFGYPILESLACGVPVLHVKYAGGAELIPRSEWLIEPKLWRLEGVANAVRPVTDPTDWVLAARQVLDAPPEVEECRASVEHLAWPKLWPTWERWLREGLK